MPKQVLNGLSFPAVSTLPSASSNTGAIFTSAGVLWYSNGVAWVQLGSIVRAASATTALVVSSTTDTYVTPAYDIPANTLYAGATFRIKIVGYCTSTAANSVSLNLRIGTSGTTSDAAIVAGSVTAATTGSNTGFTIEATVTIRSIGASGAVFGTVVLVNSGVTGLSNVATAVAYTTSSPTVATTGALFIGVSMKSSATTTAFTISTATVEQVV